MQRRQNDHTLSPVSSHVDSSSRSGKSVEDDGESSSPPPPSQPTGPLIAAPGTQDAKERAKGNLDTAQVSLQNIITFQNALKGNQAFDDEDVIRVDESVKKAKDRLEDATRVYGRYEKFYKKLLNMQVQLNERLNVLRQFEGQLDFKNEYGELGEFFHQKQMKLDAMVKQLETFLHTGQA